MENIVINLEKEGCILGAECFANNSNLTGITFTTTTFISEKNDYLINNPKLTNIVVPKDWNTTIDLTGCDSILEEFIGRN